MIKNEKLAIVLEGIIVAVICMALSFIKIEIGQAHFGLQLGLIPLSIYGLRRGLGPALLFGLVWGVLVLLIVMPQAQSLPAGQILLDYIVAFACGGAAGQFRRRLAHMLEDTSADAHVDEAHRHVPDMHGAFLAVVGAGFVAAIARWVFHFISGAVFWVDAVPAGMSPAFYSFAMNSADAGLNGIMLAVVLALLVQFGRKVFDPKFPNL